LNELKQAAASGALVSGERSYVASATGLPLSREEVRAALDTAKRNGQLAHGEFAFSPDTVGPTGTRIAGR
jgi:hypothetical protein